MELVYTGSVKDLYKDGNKLVFKYSNRYSIFDWGEMPDEIPHKGEALASMAASFFEHLAKKGIPSHFVGTVNPNTIEVKAVKVLRPHFIEGQYDYSMYQDRPTEALVPLEVIFRKHLGQGNSLEGRLKKNPAYLADLGLKEVPSGATTFDPALVEFSTKLETSDRYLTKKEIADMNIVSEGEQKALRAQTQEIVVELEKLFQSFGVKLWDGKVEYAFGKKKADGDRELLLVDSIGPDELRLTYEGLPLSKEFLRQLYGNTSWSDAVKKSKELAAERKTQDWKSICKDELKEVPKKLSAQQIEVSALLYQALANEVASVVGRKKPFAEEMTLKRWHEKAQEILGN
ncbi:phosphoribosylaminoimidazole succinocarboxamide synthase [Bdellovibrio bacteriovorus]|uniref:Phosphoribosylaminoimidazole-succinocarboxamide synthase n=1 Tax=Bdellovibrio bacteriovorus TaxID=959 RepID=A0A150WNG0_BDEBC|nr:phosphoribosylaminoimidazolesuccinocarboxamide synthase [Bdellovibrio bacteriovorus]KYG65928.1 phosphoribosylaminoimidazole succinocarboxamide synthase [Bdellovibrio bacteriovorus]